MMKKVLTTSALYISYFFKKHRVDYNDSMSKVRTKGNLKNNCSLDNYLSHCIRCDPSFRSYRQNHTFAYEAI